MEQSTQASQRNPPLEKLLTEKEAGDLLGIEVKTLQYWRWKGGGPEFVKIGRLVRYSPAALKSYCEQNRKSNTCK